MPDEASATSTALVEPVDPQAGPDITDFGKSPKAKLSLAQIVSDEMGGKSSTAIATPPKSANRAKAESIAEEMLPPKFDPNDAMGGGMSEEETRPVDEDGFSLIGDDGKPTSARAADLLKEMGYDPETGAEPEDKALEASPVAETKTEPAKTEPSVDATTKEKIARFDFFEKALADDAPAVAAGIVQSMDPRQRAAFLKELGVNATPQGNERAPFDPKNATNEDGSPYQPFGAMEEALAQRWEDIDSIPHVIADQQKIREEMQSTIGPISQNTDVAVLQSMLLREQMNVMAESLGIEFPKHDVAAMFRELFQDGRHTYDSVIKRHTESYKTLTKNAAQRESPRPQDPGNGSSREPFKKNPNITMTQIMEHVSKSKRWS